MGRSGCFGDPGKPVKKRTLFCAYARPPGCWRWRASNSAVLIPCVPTEAAFHFVLAGILLGFGHRVCGSTSHRVRMVLESTMSFGSVHMPALRGGAGLAAAFSGGGSSSSSRSYLAISFRFSGKTWRGGSPGRPKGSTPPSEHDQRRRGIVRRPPRSDECSRRIMTSPLGAACRKGEAGVRLLTP
jgi:hypothetical protein